jgi:hypothetical protein
MLSDRILGTLPPDTALTWETIARIVPPTAYLGGGTAIAVHLEHRVSRDLDSSFTITASISTSWPSCCPRPGRSRSPSAPPARSTACSPPPGCSSCTRTRCARSGCSSQPQQVDGLPVAQISDLMAMKLKVVGDRGELRDYFDLMTIEQRTVARSTRAWRCLSNVSSLSTPIRPSTTSCSASATSTTSTPTRPSLLRASRSLTTGHADSPKSSPHAAVNRTNYGPVGLMSGFRRESGMRCVLRAMTYTMTYRGLGSALLALGRELR